MRKPPYLAQLVVRAFTILTFTLTLRTFAARSLPTFGANFYSQVGNTSAIAGITCRRVELWLAQGGHLSAEP